MSIKIFLIIIILVALTGGIFWIAASKPNPKKPSTNQPKKTQLTTTIAPAITAVPLETVLMFDNLSSDASSKTYSLPIIIKAGANIVTAVQLELSFDPKLLTNIAVLPGSFFKNPAILLNNIDAVNGKIYYAIGINPQGQGTKGENTLATLAFKTRSQVPQTTTISFLPETLVTAEGQDQSVLKSAIPSQFVVGQ